MFTISAELANEISLKLNKETLKQIADNKIEFYSDGCGGCCGGSCKGTCIGMADD